MITRRILFFLLLLGIWGQAASACPEAHFAPAASRVGFEIAVSVNSEDFAGIAGEHRCECPAMVQNAQAALSESAKSLLVPYVKGSGAFLNPPNPRLAALAERNRATGSTTRPSGRPWYLFVSRLRL